MSDVTQILQAIRGGDAQAAADLLPLVNLLMQAIEPLNRLEKIVLHRRGIIAHDSCRSPSFEPDGLMLAELDRFVGRISGRLHPSAPWLAEPPTKD